MASSGSAATIWLSVHVLLLTTNITFFLLINQVDIIKLGFVSFISSSIKIVRRMFAFKQRKAELSDKKCSKGTLNNLAVNSSTAIYFFFPGEIL